mmetsp:Transcript_1202/g.2522  ORF Transcript_1202/g.2522 Transcript_1202/m.2522 type:complete len:350 (-) Transcript_1202:441-1490(-)
MRSGFAALGVVPRGEALGTLASHSLLRGILNQVHATDESSASVGSQGAANLEVRIDAFLALADSVRRLLASQAFHRRTLRLCRATRSRINRLVTLQTLAHGLSLEHLVLGAQRSLALCGSRTASGLVLGLVARGPSAHSVLFDESLVSTHVDRTNRLLVATRRLIRRCGALVSLALQGLIRLENKSLAASVLVASCWYGTARLSVSFLRALGPGTGTSFGLQGRLGRTDVLCARGLLCAARFLLLVGALRTETRHFLLALSRDEIPSANILAQLILGTTRVLVLLEIRGAWESLALLLGSIRVLVHPRRTNHGVAQSGMLRFAARDVILSVTLALALHLRLVGRVFKIV